MLSSRQPHFFDRYERFFETSYVRTRLPDGSKSPRLYNRYEAIINQNRAILDGARVLDIASHDGRWSMAALDAGADFVFGIEGRESLVAKAFRTFSDYGVAPDKFHFICSDIYKAFADLDVGRFDVVLCLGFFYHTVGHYELFREIYRLRPKYVILDTEIILGSGPIVRFKRELHDTDHKTLPTTSSIPHSVVGVPNHEMIALLSEHFGFKLRKIDWQNLGINDWRDSDDYEKDTRRTYVLEA